ncbi:helix-turn-helix transcriptional regulator [Streptosporangium sp. CA-135522]|uniref:helix-turn-helix transcriptional regulator n=1 Tax=Streptosporangium sp. CA-135522 TaxID=3240072 RepID=UPI003D8EF15E
MTKADVKTITVDQICKDLKIARSTFYDWRSKGRAPQCLKLLNGSLRVRRSAYHKWLFALEETPTARVNWDEEKLTIEYICDDLRINRSTFYDWRQKGCAPQCSKLPNSDLRVYLSDYERWLSRMEDAS